MRRIGPGGILIFSLALLSGTPARAEGTKVALESINCSDLSVTELQRVLDLELAQTSTSKAQSAGLLAATIACTGTSIEITVGDRIGRRHLLSSVPAPPNGQAGREREIALAVWTRVLEFLLENPPPTLGPPKATKGGTRAGFQTEIGVGGAARLHDVETPFFTGSPSAGAALVFGNRWRIVARTAVELGTAYRTLGSISALGLVIGVGAGWRSPRIGGLVAFDVDLLGNAVYARFAGEDTGAAAKTKEASGVSPGATFSIGPKLFVGRFHAGLAADAGVTFAPLTATVSGEAPARFGHPSVGLGLMLGLALETPSAPEGELP
jgi:hypothetical protein